ncbi:hypothetical protein [Parabacteroides sp. FAFU027]|uniref:hypothetical protein n=1 Tax=Parabacteroides sp. FAFU027 TaxID=2922715 RepID=UPI001FAF4566|nr:hypothetical protein [Parabacteroides sp. FAFU027]
MSNLRNYSYKDIVMLTACQSVAVSFKANIGILGTLRSTWTPDYADDLLARIEAIVATQVGVDAKKDQRAASEELKSIVKPAKKDLAFFKVQVEEDFKKEPAVISEVFKTLGFDKNLSQVQRGSQESVVELLLSFKQNMSDTLRTKITAKGMNVALIERIIGYADVSFAASSHQENQKTVSKEITQETANIFNALYDEVISICKIASKHYADDSTKKEQFTFSKIADKVSRTSGNNSSDANSSPTDNA